MENRNIVSIRKRQNRLDFDFQYFKIGYMGLWIIIFGWSMQNRMFGWFSLSDTNTL